MEVAESGQKSGMYPLYTIAEINVNMKQEAGITAAQKKLVLCGWHTKKDTRTPAAGA